MLLPLSVFCGATFETNWDRIKAEKHVPLVTVVVDLGISNFREHAHDGCCNLGGSILLSSVFIDELSYISPARPKPPSFLPAAT